MDISKSKQGASVSDKFALFNCWPFVQNKDYEYSVS